MTLLRTVVLVRQLEVQTKELPVDGGWLRDVLEHRWGRRGRRWPGSIALPRRGLQSPGACA